LEEKYNIPTFESINTLIKCISKIIKLKIKN